MYYTPSKFCDEAPYESHIEEGSLLDWRTLIKTPAAPVIARIHGTPAYPLTAVVGITFRLRGK